MKNYFYDMIPAEEMAQLKYFPTVPEFVTWFEKKWSNLPALSDTVNTYSYAQMGERLARRRAYLNSLGLQKGDKVAIWEKTSIDAIETFLAATSAGYVGILLPTQLPVQAVVGCCMKFGVKVLAVRDEFASQLPQVPCKVISSSAMSDDKAPVAVVDKEDPAAIFFTGGTTGAPKGAILPHRALMRGSFNSIFAPGPQLGIHRMICLLPLSHVFGLIFSTMRAFYVGAEWFSAEDVKATLGKFPMIKPTLLILVPGLCDILYGLTKMYGVQFLGGELKTIISGAANVPPRLIKAFDEIGVSLLAGYGMTEGANLTSGNADVLTHPTSVGKVYPEQDIKFVDGEIWIKGDNLFQGYYGQPEETANVMTPDGWLKTGDLGHMDEDGFLYITGRIKNIIVLSNGENISPEVIEEPFYKCAALKDCLVSEKEIDGNKVIAIEIYPQMPAFEGKPWEEVEAFFKKVVDDVNATLPSTHRIQHITVRKEDFKRTGAMKVARNQN
ncbi:MAG: acyl--CoA ligase [Bacteroidales bacterium]|nr:acyl--CoA ligase [Bacteroidales bacterium]